MPTPHEKLLEAYANSLRSAKDAAEEWWVALLALETSRTG
jgi:hypothetical protein